MAFATFFFWQTACEVLISALQINFIIIIITIVLLLWLSWPEEHFQLLSLLIAENEMQEGTKAVVSL